MKVNKNKVEVLLMEYIADCAVWGTCPLETDLVAKFEDEVNCPCYLLDEYGNVDGSDDCDDEKCYKCLIEWLQK